MTIGRARSPRLASLGYAAGSSVGSLRDGHDPKETLPVALAIDDASNVADPAVTIRSLESLRRAHPETNLIVRRLATAYQKSGNWLQAALNYERALQLGYRSSELRRTIVDMYLRAGAEADARGHQREAGPAFDRAIRVGPENPLAYEARGVWHGRHGRVAQVKEDFGRALTFDPSRWQTHYQLGLAELVGGHPDQALRQLETARRQGGAQPDVLFTVAEAARHAGQVDRAANAYRQFLAVGTKDAGRRAAAERFLCEVEHSTPCSQ